MLGGCLESICWQLKGSAAWLDPSGSILFLETADEARTPAHVDAYLTDLEQLGVFESVAALVVGRPYAYDDQARETLWRVVAERTEQAGIPVLANVDLGHTDPMLTLPLGARAELDAAGRGLRLLDSPTRAELHVRPTRAEDIDAMARLQAAAWREGFAGIVPPQLTPSVAHLAGRLRERFEDTSRGRVVAELQGEVRGFCIFGPSRDTTSGQEIGEVYVLFVDPLVWRRGLGGALLDHALAELTRSGFEEATLWSAAENARANAFYEHRRFVRDGAEQRRPEFGDALEIRYRSRLPPSGTALI